MPTCRAPFNFASLVPVSVQSLTYTLPILHFWPDAVKFTSIGLTVKFFLFWKHWLVPQLLTDLCSWFHFPHIHLYKCICKIPRYCYTQHLHHSRVFLQCIRWYLNQQKPVLFSGHSFLSHDRYHRENREYGMLQLVTCAVGSISLNSIFKRAIVRS